MLNIFKNLDAQSRTLRLRMMLLVGVPVALVCVALVYYAFGGRYVTTDNAYVTAQKALVTPSVAGRVISVSVTEGQHVQPGDVLFQIDPESYRLAMEQADAKVKSAQSSFETLRVTVASLERQVQLAKETLQLREDEYNRKADLAASKTLSKNDVDTASFALVNSRSALEMLQQQYETARVQLLGNPDLALDDFPPYADAKAAFSRAKRDYDATTVRALMAGVATQVPSVQLGRYLTPGGAVMAIVDDQKPWVMANPKETDLTYLRAGQKVTITVDAFPSRAWTGTVASLSPGTGAEFAVIPPQNASGNWVKVVQRVPIRIEFDSNANLALLKSGMSAQVEIDSGHRRIFGGAQAEDFARP